MSLQLDRAVTFGLAGAGNALTWAQSAASGNWSAAGVAAAITGIGFACVGLVTYAIRQIGAARVETLKAWDEANRATLSGQLDALKSDSEKLRASMHALRNEAQAREARHAEEVDRLTEQIALLHETNRQLRAEVDRLTARVRELTSVTGTVAAKLGGDPPGPIA